MKYNLNRKNPLKKLKIGNLKIKNPIFLAPMVDITDLPYRLICRKAGASFCYTEMLYVDAITHENMKTQKLMQTTREDSPLGIQITGNNLSSFQKAIPYLKKFDLVDLNCGCPSEKLIKSQAGSYLLNNPNLIYDIIKLLKKNKLTITAKIRLGYKKNNVIVIAKAIEKAGADAITVHPRLAVDGYDVKADWKWIKKVKEAVKIPVIANGDILDEESAINCIKQTSCDGIMIARAAIGDPLIFKRISHYLKTENKIKASFKENLSYLELYLKYCKIYQFNDISRVKRISCKFIKNIQGAAKLRQEIMSTNSLSDLKSIIKTIKK